MERTDEARAVAARLYRAAKQAREAIRELGQGSAVASGNSSENWRKYLPADLLGVCDALCEALGEEE